MYRTISRLTVVCFIVMLCACAPAAPDQDTRLAAARIYNALALQDAAKGVWLNAADLTQNASLTWGEATGTLLVAATLLSSSSDLLLADIPASLQPGSNLAKTQGRLLADTHRQWLDGGKLSIAKIRDGLKTIDTKGTLRLYTDQLLALGFSQSDIDDMQTRFESKMHELAQKF